MTASADIGATGRGAIPRSAVAAGASVSLPALLVWGLAGLMFLLTASNGEPQRTSSGYYVALLAPFIILLRGPGAILRAADSKPNRPIFIALLVFTTANILSTLLTPNEDTFYALLQRCLLPMLVYLSMTGLVLTRRDQLTFVLAICAGALVIFVRGSIAYHAEFGIPDLQTILWSRYNIVRIEGYETATVGNVTHMGSYVALILPMLIIARITIVRSKAVKHLIDLTIAIGLANLIVSGSRAGMVILLCMTAVIAYVFASRKTLITFATVAAVVTTLIVISGAALSESKIVERLMPGAAGRVDGSVVERLDSMVIGWRVFLDHILLGVGPDMSNRYNIHGIPHQSILHQLSELGLVGGLAFVWLNAVLLYAFSRAAFATVRDPSNAFQLLWLIGPVAWLLMGLFSGLVFNMSMALLWVGIAHGMLALAGAREIPETAVRPSISLRRILRGLKNA